MGVVWIALLGCAVAVLVALVSVRQLVVQSELLDAQRALREAQADRAMLLDRTISRGEQERVRIAAELHDGPVQRLAALGYLLERSARLTRRGDGGGLALVDEALAELSGEVELPREELALEVVRGVVPVEVEPRLADRDHPLVQRQLPEGLHVWRERIGRMVSDACPDGCELMRQRD